jgi:hypothetical protein
MTTLCIVATINDGNSVSFATDQDIMDRDMWANRRLSENEDCEKATRAVVRQGDTRDDFFPP